jgi:hypothetical protein
MVTFEYVKHESEKERIFMTQKDNKYHLTRSYFDKYPLTIGKD